MILRAIFVALLLLPLVSSAELKCEEDADGNDFNCVYITGWKDPRYTITEEDMKGMVYVSPEQKRKMDEKIFKEALENEITARMYQDRVATREQAIKDILSGVPRKVR